MDTTSKCIECAKHLTLYCPHYLTEEITLKKSYSPYTCEDYNKYKMCEEIADHSTRDLILLFLAMFGMWFSFLMTMSMFIG